MRARDARPEAVVHAGVASVSAFGRGVRRIVSGSRDPSGEADVSLLIDAPPSAVWDVLAHGAGYGDWVLGANQVIEVDDDWPAVGSSLHYSVGVGPIEVRDRTTVRQSLPAEQLDLDIVAWPLGSVRVLIRLEARSSMTLVHLDEHPGGGPLRWVHTPLGSAGFAARGTVMLRRLRDLVETPAIG